MPYKYIGRTTDFKGKTLWEIVGNLKNFGVGRIVVRSRFERYPEPSYCKILKVEPLQCPEIQNMDNLRKVRVLVERTFRGKTFPKPVMIESTSYKADYRLLSKEEETNYCKAITAKEEVKVLPKTMEYPPLLKELLLREAKAKGIDTKDELKLEIVYKMKSFKNYRIAEDGEEFSVNMQKLPNISLYRNINVETK